MQLLSPVESIVFKNRCRLITIWMNTSRKNLTSWYGKKLKEARDRKEWLSSRSEKNNHPTWFTKTNFYSLWLSQKNLSQLSFAVIDLNSSTLQKKSIKTKSVFSQTNLNQRLKTSKIIIPPKFPFDSPPSHVVSNWLNASFQAKKNPIYY